MTETILIVDDDLDTLKLVGTTLEQKGYKVEAASNGHQALELAELRSPDLIILDVMMPEVDGYEVLRRLREHPKLAYIPIVMYSAKAQVEDKVKGLEAGADDYLTKLTFPAELTARVKAILKQPRERGQDKSSVAPA